VRQASDGTIGDGQARAARVDGATAGGRGQVAQRVRVGMTGLAAVLLLIVLATVVFRAVRTERPIAGPGAARPDLVENLASLNGGDARDEPLAELGVAPAAPGNAGDALR
jgi:hypothetical protein